MRSKKYSCDAGDTKILEQMGGQIKLVRLRRKLSAELVAERAGISRSTLWNVERGSSSVAIGSCGSTSRTWKYESDLLLVAKDDVLGRKLQDLELTNKRGKGNGGDKYAR